MQEAGCPLFFRVLCHAATGNLKAFPMVQSLVEDPRLRKNQARCLARTKVTEVLVAESSWLALLGVL